jgi:hypothetical protein
MKTIWAESAGRRLAFRGGVLGLAVAALAAVLLPVAGLMDGRAGVGAAAAAAAVCVAGAASALGISHLLRGPELALPSLLLGMAARTGLPLLLAMVIQFRGGPLADAGFLYYLLVFYPVTLSLETILSLPPNRGQGTGDRGAAAATTQGVVPDPRGDL